MPFEIIQDHFAPKAVDALVTAAQPQTRPALFGPRTGSASISVSRDPAFRHVIQTLCPIWTGAPREKALLKRCYTQSLKLAKRKNCASVALPLLAAEDSGFPKPLVLQTAMDAIQAFLKKHEMQIYVLVPHREAFQLPDSLLRDLSNYLKRNCTVDIPRSPEPDSAFAGPMHAPQMQPPSQMPAKRAKGIPLPSLPQRDELAKMLLRTDAGFSETLLMLIDKTGKKDSEIYSKANVSRQHFSKIRNNPDYKPSKPTAIAFAIALELDLQQTKDLIGRAGYALTSSSKFDVIIMYFIQKRNYDLFEINSALFEFDQSLLGT